MLILVDVVMVYLLLIDINPSILQLSPYTPAFIVCLYVSSGVLWMVLLFFFFSSRRRHTRFDCDWSSDVCSSDLGQPGRPDDLVLGGFLAQRDVLPDGRGEEEALLENDGGGLLERLGRQPPKRSGEHTSGLQSQSKLVCRPLPGKKKTHTAVEK